jgi:hypothetical protein
MRVRLGFILLVSAAVFVFHSFVRFRFFFEDLRNSQAAFGRKVPQITDNLPHFVVFQDPFPSRHSGRANAVIDDPLQLAIRVFLNVLR